MRFSLASVVAIISFLSNQVNASEEVRVVSPLDLATQFSFGGKFGVLYDTPALFGIPSYQTAISGPVYYAIPSDGCGPLNTTAMGIRPNLYGSQLVYMDRGTCSFTTKVRNAGFASFQTAIIGDNIDESTLPYMADDGSTPAVTAPSVLITYRDAAKLKAYLQTNTSVIMSVEYSLPNPDNRVEYDLWTTSVDPIAAPFKHMFSKPAKVLDYHALFTPHYFTISGASIGCTSSNFPCGNQCTNGGRYCAVDPERNTTTGLTGRDVIQENLRQWCLFNVSLTNNIPQYKWFDYVTAFDANCGNPCSNEPTNPSDPNTPDCPNGFAATCSYNQMAKLGLPKSQVQQCVSVTGGSDSNNGINYIQEKFITDRQESGVFFTPTLNINLQAYRGTLTCPVPTDLANCGPLAGICRGFSPESVPLACQTSQGCDVGSIKDVCGNCDGVGPDCHGCDGVVNSKLKYDSCGVCNGPGTRLGSCLSDGALAAIFIFTILGAVLIGVAVWYYMKRQSRVMRDDIDSLLKQYLPLEGGTGKSHETGTRLVDDANDI